MSEGTKDLVISVLIKSIDSTGSSLGDVAKKLDAITDASKGITDATGKAVTGVANAAETAEKAVSGVAAEAAKQWQSRFSTLNGYANASEALSSKFDGISHGLTRGVAGGVEKAHWDAAQAAAKHAEETKKIADENARSGAELEKQPGKFAQLTQSVEPYLTKLKAIAPTLIGAAAGGAAFAWVEAGITRVLDLGDAYAELSKKTGIAIEQMGGLKFAAEQSDTSLEAVTRGIAFMERNLGNVGKAGEHLRKLGIIAKEPMEAFLQVSAAIVKTEDPMARASIAQAAFGKSWMELMPILQEGPEAIGRMMARGDQLYGLTQKQAEAAAELRDKQQELNSAMNRLSMDAGLLFVPKLNDIAVAAAKASEDSGLLMAAWVGLGGVASEFVVEPMIEGTKALADQALKLNNEVAMMMQNAIYGAAKNAKAALSEAGKWIVATKNELMSKARGMATEWVIIGENIVQGMIDGISKRAAALYAKVKGVGDSVKKAIMDVLDMHSPSKEMERLGEFVADGFTIGILAGTSRVENAAKVMASKARDAATLDEILNPGIEAKPSMAGKDIVVWRDEYARATAKDEADAMLLAAEAHEASVSARERSIRSLDALIERIEPARGKTRQFAESMDELTEAVHAGYLDLDRYAELTEKLATDSKHVSLTGDGDMGKPPTPIEDGKDTEKKALSELQSAIEGYSRRASKAFVDFAITGKSSFKDMTKSIMADMAQMAIEKTIAKPITGALSNAMSGLNWSSLKFWADGGVPGGPSVSAWRNQVVNRPTLFAFANGAGVMGEAGPEAIMPLTRGADGRLGVQAHGGDGGNVTIEQHITVDARGADAGVEQKIYLAMQRAKQEAVAAVAESFRCGGPMARAVRMA